MKERKTVARITAQYDMRASAFEQVQPDYRETIQSMFSIFPLNDHVAGALLSSANGPEIAYALANNIDAIDEVNAMPPQQLAREIAKLEGQLLERQRHQQHQVPPRKTTRAAPPMSRLSGGASRGNDDASSMSMDEYVSKRKAGWNG